MNKLTLTLASLCLLAGSVAAHADSASGPVTCKDGTTSAASGRGACSGHGGVNKAATASTATAAAPAAAPAAPAAAPAPVAAPVAAAAPTKK